MFTMPGCFWLSRMITITILLSCSLGTAWYFWRLSSQSVFFHHSCCGGSGGGKGPSVCWLNIPFQLSNHSSHCPGNRSLMLPEKSIYPFYLQRCHDTNWAVCVCHIKHQNIHMRLLLSSLAVWAAQCYPPVHWVKE